MEEKKFQLKRYNSIEGLRAASAVLLVLFHIHQNTKIDLGVGIINSIIESCTYLTFFFMMISAFSMCCGYYDRISNGKISVSEFYEKRYERILPFFALLVGIDIIISPSISSLIEGFANLTLCFGLLPNAQISVIGVGWTLGVIFIFYMLFPFFCFALKNKKRAWLAMLVAVIFNLVCLVYFFDSNHVKENFYANTSVIYCAMFFMAGGLIYLYRDKLAALVQRLRFLVLFLAFGVTGLYCAIPYMELNNLYYIVCNITLLMMFSLWLIYAVGSDSKLLYNRVTRFLSNISFEIYLCHMMFYRILERLHLIKLFGDGWASYLFTSALTLCGAIVFSFAAKKAIDYFLKLIKEKFNKKA